ncbi:MAG: DEAD/DEAH box helicase [Patescibacteria group bacterium]|nr:DEAD/DEAH box helicase [Patescibacteria group bacterium]MDE2437769.1 DEAD/DEAH box helicase [Patescibacteria group bacterium]
MNTHNTTEQFTFTTLGIVEPLLDSLTRLGLKIPTPIQHEVIPVALTGQDVVGIAQTGTGKTLAFGIPMIQRLAATKGVGMIVLPTRELALQVDESLRRVGQHLGMRTAVLIGGAAMGPQIQALRRNPHIIIATPGRLIDHIQQKTIQTNHVSIIVLDEADHMFDMGFAPQVEKILDALPRARQTMLFSATMPHAIMNLATAHMKSPIRVEVAPSGTPPEKVEQELYILHKEDKTKLLKKLLEYERVSTIVFTRTKHGASKLVKIVRAMGYTAAEIHGNRSLPQRKDALDGFKSGKYRVLVATDVAARGIDVQGVGLVINYDVPENPEDYVHRIGRTARAGATGHAITFVTQEQRNDLRDIERLINQKLTVVRDEELSQEFSPTRKVISAGYRHRRFH